MSTVLVFSSMTVQLYVLEWMRKRKLKNAYELAKAGAKASNDVSEATIYRLVRSKGEVENVRADTLDALAKVFGCDVADLFRRPER